MAKKTSVSWPTWRPATRPGRGTGDQFSGTVVNGILQACQPEIAIHEIQGEVLGQTEAGDKFGVVYVAPAEQILVAEPVMIGSIELVEGPGVAGIRRVFQPEAYLYSPITSSGLRPMVQRRPRLATQAQALRSAGPTLPFCRVASRLYLTPDATDPLTRKPNVFTPSLSVPSLPEPPGKPPGRFWSRCRTYASTRFL